MNQIQIQRPEAKALQRYPEIAQLTEARKRAIAGGRASIGEALKQMTLAAQRPTGNVIEYKDSTQSGPATPETPAARALREQQNLIDQARSAAQAAGDQATIINESYLKGAA